jgi:hypothetical protein
VKSKAENSLDFCPNYYVQEFGLWKASVPRMLKIRCVSSMQNTPVAEIIEPIFAKTSQKRSSSMTEYERFWLVFTKTRVYKFGHWCLECPSGGVYRVPLHLPCHNKQICTMLYQPTYNSPFFQS